MIEFLSKRKAWIAVAIIATAAALRFACLGSFSYFIDEIHAINFTHGGLLAALRLLPETPGTAPLDYGLVSLLQRVSTSESFMRLPYALAGTWSVFLTYRIGARWFSAKNGLIAAGLMALSSAHIFYSQSIRCYSISTLLILLTINSYYNFFIDGESEHGPRFAAYSFLAALNQFFSFIPLGFLILSAVMTELKRAGKDPDRRKRVAVLIITSALLAVVFMICIRLILAPKNLGVMRSSPPMFAIAIQIVKSIAQFTSLDNAFLDAVVFIFFISGLFAVARLNRNAFRIIFWAALLPLPLIALQEIRLKQWRL